MHIDVRVYSNIFIYLRLYIVVSQFFPTYLISISPYHENLLCRLFIIWT